MRQQLSAYFDNAITLLLLVVVGLTPLLFFNQTTEFYEMPKLVFLIVATLVIAGLWIFSWILKGKVVINRTPLDIPLLLLLVVVLLSTYFSTSQLSSVYGNFPNVHGSAVAWVTYILLYFVTASQLRSLAKIKSFLYVLYGSATIVALITLLAFFNVFLPFDFAKGINFTPTGSSFSTVAFLLLMLPLPLLSLVRVNKYLPAPVAVVLTLLFSITIALIGSLPTHVALVLTYALCLFLAKPHKETKTLPLVVLTVVLVALVYLLAYLPGQLPAGVNALQKMEANYPKEIQLPLSISWKISASAFRDAPFIGTGPSTYLFNFTSYKPAEFNLLKYWNFSFDKASDEFLQFLGTLGLLGLAALVFICLVVVTSSWRNLSVHAAEHEHDSTHVVLPALAVSGLLSVVLLAVHATTLVSIVVTLFIFAALMMSQKSVRDRVMELSLGIRASTSDNKQFDLFPIIIFIVFLVLAVPAFYKTFNAVAADYYHRQALSVANTNGTLTYQNLQKAETLNPQIDLYRVDMAQTNFALANAIAIRAQQQAQKSGSTSAALSAQDKATIQTLLSQAVNEGRASVALSPRSSRNWEVLASIYQNITGVAQNALTFALDGYGRAIQRDPLNPALRVNVGGIYYTVKNYSLAIRFFSDAANLKPDYVVAYYNLAIALRDSGDLQNAQLVAQQAVALLQDNKNSPDYKTATKLVDELKAKIANGQQATAGQTGGALQNTDLNNVNAGTNNPPQPATPAAVQANPQTKLPAAVQNTGKKK